jgi:hypothetical protein
MQRARQRGADSLVPFWDKPEQELPRSQASFFVETEMLVKFKQRGNIEAP